MKEMYNFTEERKYLYNSPEGKPIPYNLAYEVHKTEIFYQDFSKQDVFKNTNQHLPAVLSNIFTPAGLLHGKHITYLGLCQGFSSILPHLKPGKKVGQIIRPPTYQQ